MDYQKLLDTIDALQEKYFRFWAEICEEESPTEYKTGVDAVGKIFIRKAGTAMKNKRSIHRFSDLT